MNPEIRKPIEFSRERRAYYEGRLWEEAEHLAETKAVLKKRQAELYDLLHKGNKSEDFNKIRKLEDEYWGIPDSLTEVEEKEAQVQDLLLRLDEGSVDESELRNLFPDGNGEAEQVRLTKSKQRRLEQLKAIRDGISGVYFDSYGFGYDLGYWERGNFGNEPNRLTTGRHATGIKGSFSPEDVASEFYYQTSDTHGGKVGHGKSRSGGHYVTKSGKRIRKR